MKKQTSSLNTGVFLSRKSLASSTMTGSSVSSSSTWRVWKRNNNAAWHRFQIKRVELGPEPALKTSHLRPQHSAVIYNQSAGFCVGRCVFRGKEEKKKEKAAVTHRHPSVVTGAAGNEDKSPTPLDLFDVVLQSPQDHWWSHTSS